MRYILCFIGCILVCSCNYFENKKISPQEALNQQLQSFSWNEVDTYPKFANCDSIIDKTESKNCFQSTIVNEVKRALHSKNIVASSQINDTIKLNLSIDKSGVISVKETRIKTKTKMAIPQIDSLLNESILSLPRLHPAIKRGQPVSTEFTLPVVVHIQ